MSQTASGIQVMRARSWDAGWTSSVSRSSKPTTATFSISLAARGWLLSLPGTTFEERALPPGSLRQPYLTMRLTGELPPNTVIEVSEVAPAFGRQAAACKSGSWTLMVRRSPSLS